MHIRIRDPHSTGRVYCCCDCISTAELYLGAFKGGVVDCSDSVVTGGEWRSTINYKVCISVYVRTKCVYIIIVICQ